MQVLVTGAAGFIGYHVAQRLLQEGIKVYGIDNLNNYYAVTLKQSRLAQLQSAQNFRFRHLDLNDSNGMAELFQQEFFDGVIHLAAQSGVRYSLANPLAVVDSNLIGFIHVLEGCRHNQIPHLVFASSSSVYGNNTKVPFSIGDNVDHPVSLYAATKRSNELMAYSYSHLYQIPITGLRLFTVYGPWGRPDMAYFKFVNAISKGHPIDIYNYGEIQRDFTYIDDVVEGIIRVLSQPPEKAQAAAPYKLYNIGNNQPVTILRMIEIIEAEMGKTVKKNWLPMQPGDVPVTYADVDSLIKEVGFQPKTSIEEGIHRFLTWYIDYYQT